MVVDSWDEGDASLTLFAEMYFSRGRFFKNNPSAVHLFNLILRKDSRDENRCTTRTLLNVHERRVEFRCRVVSSAAYLSIYLSISVVSRIVRARRFCIRGVECGETNAARRTNAPLA